MYLFQLTLPSFCRNSFIGITQTDFQAEHHNSSTNNSFTLLHFHLHFTIIHLRCARFLSVFELAHHFICFLSKLLPAATIHHKNKTISAPLWIMELLYVIITSAWSYHEEAVHLAVHVVKSWLFIDLARPLHGVGNEILSLPPFIMLTKDL